MRKRGAPSWTMLYLSFKSLLSVIIFGHVASPSMMYLLFGVCDLIVVDTWPETLQQKTTSLQILRDERIERTWERWMRRVLTSF